MTWYKTGTVNVTNGQTYVSATGTRFASNCRVGDGFRGPDGAWYEVLNISSDTVLGIYPAYQGVSVSGSSNYVIAPIQGYVKNAADKLNTIAAGIQDISQDVATSKSNADAAQAAYEAAHTSELAAKVSETNAASSASNASNSESSASTSAQQAAVAKTAAEKARDDAIAAAGTVTGNLSDMGAWDASTGVYPNKPAVSAFWKVTGNGSATDNGEAITYGIGDTLVWSKPLEVFYKIDNTEAVSSVNGHTGVVVLTKADIQLSDVDNTSDANKPISTATAVALAGKEPTIPTGTSIQYINGSKQLSDFTASTIAVQVSTLALENQPIQAGDTIQVAISKTQGQLNNKLGVTDTASDSSKLGGQLASYYTTVMVGATDSTNGTKGLVPPPTISDKNRFLKGDGTYGDADGSLPVGSLVPWHISEATIPGGYIPANGQLLNRSVFPQLWSLVSATAVTDTEWLSTDVLQGRFSSGDGSTTFRMPDINGKRTGGTIQAMFLRGHGRNSSGTPGNSQSDQLQGFTLGATEGWALAEVTLFGAAASTQANFRGAYHTLRDTPGAGSTLDRIQSDGVNGTPRVGGETRPTNVAVVWCFIGGTVSTNQGSIDITATASQVTAQASQIQNLQATQPKKWVSDWRTLGSNLGSVFVHNLGKEFDLIRWEMKLKVAQSNWAIGTVLSCDPSKEAGNGKGLIIWDSGTTQFRVKTGSGVNGTYILDATTGAQAAVPWANFDIRCTVLAF